MNYELDDLDRELLGRCRSAVQDDRMDALDEDDFREAVELLVNIAAPGKTPMWPHRCEYLSSIGYVVWRDVFEGDMRCALDDAVKAHKVAVFVTESEADDYCNFRNRSGL